LPSHREAIDLKYRTFGRLGWLVSEIGCGTWGMGGGESGWQGGSDESANASLLRAVELGCNFFDTAWIYGRGHSEKLVGAMAESLQDKRLHIATKIPPKNMNWPSRRQDRIEDVFPYDHVMAYADRSLANLGLECIDLLQFHVWEDDWADKEEWQRAVEDLKRQGKIAGVGISVNTWEPTNVLHTLKTGLIDAVQVIYNVFEQQPEDDLFPYCKANDIAVVARVPFDEGSLTGSITRDTRFDESDWRASYFVEDNLRQCVPRVERIIADLAGSMSLTDFALRFVLDNPSVSTVIPGMRRTRHVESNIGVSGLPPLPAGIAEMAKRHRWDRKPTAWSQ